MSDPASELRVQAESGAVYVVDPILHRARGRTLRPARRVFRNYRFHEREWIEATDDEWLAVELRTVDPEQAAVAVRGLREEVLEIVVPLAPWFGEALDWIEAPAVAEGSPDPLPRPILVRSAPLGTPLPDWRTAAGADLLLQAALELLGLVEALETRDLVLLDWDAANFRLDPAGRWECLSSESVLSTAAPVPSAWCDSRSAQPPSAGLLPEVRAGAERCSTAGNLWGWAHLAGMLLGADIESAVATGLMKDPRLSKLLESGGTNLDPERIPRALADVLRAAASDDPAARPASAADVRRCVSEAAQPRSWLARWKERRSEKRPRF